MNLDDLRYGDEPNRWVSGKHVTTAQEAYNWLTLHLKTFNRLYYTNEGKNSSLGYQPFVLARDRTMKATWLRGLSEHNPDIVKISRVFKKLQQTHEFITWVIPNLGCLTVYIQQGYPKVLSYLSDKEMVNDVDGVEPDYTKYIQNFKQAKSPESVLDTMCRFVLTNT